MLSFRFEFNVASGSSCFCNSKRVFSFLFFKDGGCALSTRLLGKKTIKKRGSVETSDHGLLQLQQPEQSPAHV